MFFVLGLVIDIYVLWWGVYSVLFYIIEVSFLLFLILYLRIDGVYVFSFVFFIVYKDDVYNSIILCG